MRNFCAQCFFFHFFVFFVVGVVNTNSILLVALAAWDTRGAEIANRPPQRDVRVRQGTRDPRARRGTVRFFFFNFTSTIETFFLHAFLT